MKRIIEVEETVKLRHQIFIEAENDEQITEAVNRAEENNCQNLDEYIDALAEVISVQDVNEDYYEETESIEYFDDYEDDSE